MNNFEVTLLFSPDNSTQNIGKIEETFAKLITDNGGSVINKEEWGLRDIAYKLQEYNKAFYNFYQISIEGNKIQIIKKNLSLNEKILRFLFIKVDEHEKLPTKIMKSEEN